MASIKNGSLGPSAAKPLTEVAPPFPFTLEHYRSNVWNLKCMEVKELIYMFSLYATKYFSVSDKGHESGCGSQAGQRSNQRSTDFNHGITGQFINLPEPQLPN